MNRTIVVVGAGPGGLAAATTAAEAGLDTVVLDESGVPGGQYLHPPTGEIINHPIAARFVASGARLRLGENVWHADATRRVLRTSSGSLNYDALIVATGAYDRPLAAPGWQLNNVMTAGAAQLLAKQGVKLPEPVLLVGSGPFAFALADRLLRASTDVSEVSLTHFPRMEKAAFFSPSILREGLSYLSKAGRARLPIRSGWALSEVVGDKDGNVRGAWLEGMPNTKHRNSRRFVKCRSVAAGYGFLPQLALFDLLTCELRFDRDHRTWFVSVNSGTTATSVPGVFAAGEATGIGGHRKALAEGHLAGLEATAWVRGTGRQVRMYASRKRVNRMRQFAVTAAPALAPPPLAGVVADESVVCRCEGVTAAHIRAAAMDGAESVSGVRLRTRAGMGTCQARMCMQMCGELVELHHDLQDGGAGRIVARTPARPLTVRDGSS